MKELKFLHCTPSNTPECLATLTKSTKEGNWIQLLTLKENKVDIPNHLLPNGSGIILSTGGSSGEKYQCLHPYNHLNQSAIATSNWLKKGNIEFKDCLILNSLPINHVSGLMPWWRSKVWEIDHRWICPSLMRNPYELEKSCQSILKANKHLLLTSLVPTQLHRLINTSSGIRWLQSFSVIWVGGSSLPKDLANLARCKKIRLAPCYGTTETMAMVTALHPDDFLDGDNSSGSPLSDVELRLGKENALEVRSSRIAKIIWENRKFKTIINTDGWWISGDSAEIINNGDLNRLKIIGRLDTAIHSGGETIFPERIQQRLIDNATKAQIPIQSLLLTSAVDQEWGERLIALVRFNDKYKLSQLQKIFKELKELVKDWIPAERPKAWYYCPTLQRNINEKWELSKWKVWVKTQRPII